MDPTERVVATAHPYSHSFQMLKSNNLLNLRKPPHKQGYPFNIQPPATKTNQQQTPGKAGTRRSSCSSKASGGSPSCDVELVVFGSKLRLNRAFPPRHELLCNISTTLVIVGAVVHLPSTRPGGNGDVWRCSTLTQPPMAR